MSHKSLNEEIIRLTKYNKKSKISSREVKTAARLLGISKEKINEIEKIIENDSEENNHQIMELDNIPMPLTAKRYYELILLELKKQ